MLKYWKMLRGFKRQAGAVVMALYVVLEMSGVSMPEEIRNNIGLIGSIIFGIGWLDKGGAALSEKLKGNKE
jgi:hypothetical protein